MLSFRPRPFPPLSLAGVPIEYIVKQLHILAPHYWDNPDSADCTIIVPVPHAVDFLFHDSPSSSLLPSSPTLASMFDTASGAGRRARATQPAMNLTPRISFKLHMDYLCAHSSYLRGLLSGALPLDLMHSSSPPNTATHPLFGNSSIPPERLPRLMPCSPDHPILYLPVPDPTSFQMLIHWMYFGDTAPIEDCLRQGSIQWEGIARNAEYLGLSAELKIFLAQWYNNWMNSDRDCSLYDSDDDSDTAYSDIDTDIDDGDDSTTASESEDHHPKFMDDQNELEPIRGRTRTTRPLSYQPPLLSEVS